MTPSQSLLSVVCLLAAFASAFSALDRPRDAFLEQVLESRTADQKYCKPTGLIEDACCDFETVENVNTDLFHGLKDIVATPYFRYHKVDLYRECPFWQEDGSCMNRACGIETTEEADIPPQWRSQTLGELKANSGATSDDIPGQECGVHDSDFCVLEDEADQEGQYIDLLQNPERFTGYAGASSSRVWKAIYEENCFTPVPYIDPSRPVSDGGSGFAPIGLTSLVSSGMSLGALTGGLGTPPTKGTWGDSERKLVGNLAGPRDGGDEVCLEKRVFYRVISGLHASISLHICDDYMDQKTGQWAPNLECFITRIGQHPERLQNVYFTYVILLRALSKAGSPLIDAVESTLNENKMGADGTRVKLENLVKTAQACPSTFDETSMFSGPSASILITEFKEHFRNVSRIMDCVGCDKCRLWGKLQVTGLGTALKLLFAPNESSESSIVLPSPLSENDTTTQLKQHHPKSPIPLKLTRGEVVAFVNTLHRLSESLAAIEKFRVLWARRELKQLKSEKTESPQRKRVLPAIVAERPRSETAEEEEKEEKPVEIPPARQYSPSPTHVEATSTVKKRRMGASQSVTSDLKAVRLLTTGLESGQRGKGLFKMLAGFCKDGWTRCLEVLRIDLRRWNTEL